jgi:hypothetical protein
LDQENQFSLGRAAEISRDEVKFQKFVDRLRKKFSWLFLDLLKTQLILKSIIVEADWEEIKENIVVDFIKDSQFSELKEAEILRDRLALLGEMDQYIGKYYSIEWVRKNILRQSDSDVENIQKQIEKERSSGDIPDEEDLSSGTV